MLAVSTRCVALALLTVAAVSHSQIHPVTSLFEAEYCMERSAAAVNTQWHSRVMCSDGDWLGFGDIDFGDGVFDSAIVYLINNWDDTQGGEAEVHLDSRDGPLIGTVTGITRTDWGDHTIPKAFTGAISAASGVRDVYFVFNGDASTVVGYIDRLGFKGSVDLSTTPAQDYYVSTKGDDTNPGTALSPFRTVQKGVSMVRPGGNCYIRQGIYRETIKPACSGVPGAEITIAAYNNENVVLTGTDSITGWTQHAGSIYKAVPGWSLGEYQNQVFCDGKMMWMARSPNVDESCLEYERWPYFIKNCLLTRQGEIFGPLIPGLMPANCITPRIDTDDFREYDQSLWAWEMPQALLNRPANFFAGGLITAFTSWYATVGYITSSDPSVAPTQNDPGSVQFYADRIALQRSGAGRGFVSHLYSLLDAPREWFFSNDTLYAWMPQSDSPDNHLVEMKRRLVVVNLNGRSHINLVGIRVLGGSVTMSNCRNCVVDRCDIRHASHFDAFTNAETNMHWDPTWDSTQYDPGTGWKGVYVSGQDNIIRNSTIAYSSGSGIMIDGINQTITNCRIHDCNYTCTYDAGILVCTGKAVSYGHHITHNSIYNIGRTGIHFAFGGGDLVDPTVIHNNDFRISGLLAYETGHIYCFGGSGFNSEVYHNWFHDQAGSGNGHIALDNGHSLWKIHHNVFWNGENRTHDEVLFCNISLDTSDEWGALDTFYNNTFIDTSIVGEYWWVVETRWDDPEQIVYGPGWNNLMCVGDTARWMFTDPGNYDFTLREGSPAIDRGEPVPGKDLSFTGTAPDLGAYEFGQPRWVAGVDWEEQAWVYPPPVISEDRVISNRGLHPRHATVRVNPTGIRVFPSENAPVTVSLFGLNGRLVAWGRGSHRNPVVLGTAGIGQGTYLIRIVTTHGSFCTKLCLGGVR